MRKSLGKTHAGLTPAKLALIIVLCLILATVLAVQFGGRGTAPLLLKDSGGAQAPPSQEPLAPAAELPLTEVAASWPEISRAEALMHDPFQLPQSLRSKTVDRPRSIAREETAPSTVAAELARHQRYVARIEALRTRGVEMVLMTPRGRIARLGGLTVREGDLLDGMRVLQIHSRGLVLAPDTGAAGLAGNPARILSWLKDQLLGDDQEVAVGP